MGLSDGSDQSDESDKSDDSDGSDDSDKSDKSDKSDVRLSTNQLREFTLYYFIDYCLSFDFFQAKNRQARKAIMRSAMAM